MKQLTLIETPLVLYHAACKDGFAAAWAYYRAKPEAQFVAIQHGDRVPLELISGRDVTFVDFCFKRYEMVAVFNAVRSLRVIDHHVTAAEEMGKVVVEPQRASDILRYANSTSVPDFAEEYGGDINFDMKKSGAGLTWDLLHPGTPRPWIIDYVEDRDLWSNALPDTRPINAYISTLPFDFKTWDEVGLGPIPPQDFLDTYGKAALAKTFQYVREVAGNAMRVTFEGYNVPIVNAPQYDISELLNYLATNERFAMGWWQMASGRYKYSLRAKEKSGEGAIDVSALAAKYGGGGHPSAAGFEADTLIHLKWRN